MAAAHCGMPMLIRVRVGVRVRVRVGVMVMVGVGVRVGVRLPPTCVAWGYSASRLRLQLGLQGSCRTCPS